MSSSTILYMTGTGNTARAAGVIEEKLSTSGWKTRRVEMRKGADAPKGDFTDDLLVLCFPIPGFGMPAHVRPFLRCLKGRGRSAAVFVTYGGDAGSAIWQACRILRRRGFRVIASGGAEYPFNWTQVFPPPREARIRPMVRDGDSEARRFADSLAAAEPGKAEAAGRFRIIDLLWMFVSFLYSSMGRFALAAFFSADSRCNSCGECVRDCPAGSIVLRGGGARRRPRWLARCQGCNRCINLCPEKSIQSSLMRIAVHMLVNVALIVAVVMGLERLSAAAALPWFFNVPLDVALLVLSVVYGTRIQIVGLEPILFALEGMPGLRGLVGRSWTARFGRYRCEGFEPEKARRLNPSP